MSEKEQEKDNVASVEEDEKKQEDTENKDEDAGMEDDNLDYEKIKMLPGSSEDGTIAAFQIIDEDHTLGNALRYMIMKNPEVEFCGYSIPHPSENKMNIRIQTYGEQTAVDALHKGLDDLSKLCSFIEDTFMEKVNAKDYTTEEP
ncbi:RNA polymerase subunit AC19 [Brettanomyces bruxellensis]|uniref:DNA-directed RNA polymerases I and III subunit RPAC2 n=1 Tax=Dekkera bruxellensis TaxID=5007 RepID=A0A7D9CV26_DEKBR|nr:RNA polymerase subunit AC19 [Brettanomyces bruxellensis]VUG16254.1 RPC19 [Brettanomyces bruxellensis]